MVSPKRTATFPSGRSVLSISRVLDTARRSGGTISVSPKTALKSGSSQQGKARRASVASNWVVAMSCSSPASSVKVLR